MMWGNNHPLKTKAGECHRTVSIDPSSSTVLALGFPPKIPGKCRLIAPSGSLVKPERFRKRTGDLTDLPKNDIILCFLWGNTASNNRSQVTANKVAERI